MSPGTPQELTAWRITVRHLPVLQVILLHSICGDELLGLPINEMLPPSIHSHHIQKIPDVFLKGTIALYEDHTQDD